MMLYACTSARLASLLGEVHPRSPCLRSPPAAPPNPPATTSTTRFRPAPRPHNLGTLLVPYSRRTNSMIPSTPLALLALCRIGSAYGWTDAQDGLSNFRAAARGTGNAKITLLTEAAKATGAVCLDVRWGAVCVLCCVMLCCKHAEHSPSSGVSRSLLSRARNG
jgi:hypothetical protein